MSNQAKWAARVLIGCLVFVVAMAVWAQVSVKWQASSTPNTSSNTAFAAPQPTVTIAQVAPPTPTEDEGGEDPSPPAPAPSLVSATTPYTMPDILGKTVPQVVELLKHYTLNNSSIQPGEYGTQVFKAGDKCHVAVYYDKRAGKLVCAKFQLRCENEQIYIPLRDVLPSNFTQSWHRFETLSEPIGGQNYLFTIYARLGEKSDPHYWLVSARVQNTGDLQYQSGSFDDSGRRTQTAYISNWLNASVTEVYGAMGGPDIREEFFEDNYQDTNKVQVELR